MAAHFRVRAIYEYSSPHEDDLNFDIGQIITVTDEDDDDWYGGEYVDADGVKKEGIFPRNFVELVPVEPPARIPARPRSKKESDPPKSPEQTSAPPPPPPAEPAVPEPAPAPAPEPETVEPAEPVPKSPPPQPAAPAVPSPTKSKPVETPASAPAPPAPAPKAAEPAQAPKPKPAAPPPVSEKPSSNSFKDRIAAFNKPAAPPIAPFKPSGLSAAGKGGGSSGFVKKPFVAPPPSRNAYVPPPQQAPVSKVYRREEDPEIKEKEAENKEQAEKAGLVSHEGAETGEAEDQPKPTTLKERIALLQQQQREQAARHADSAAKKEKPKKPPKKPTVEAAPAPVPAPAPAEEAAEGEVASPVVPPMPERRSIDEAARRASTDDGSASRIPPPQRRKSSKAEPVHDGNEADMSGAGDTTEGQDDTTEREDNDEPSLVPHAPAPAARPAQQEGQAESQEEEEEEEEDDDMDPETKRKEELRARMAKMSGGMGFHGMFGMPVPGAGAPPKKKKPAPKPEAPVEEETEEAPASPRVAPPVPTMMALPGFGGPRKSEDTARPDEDEVASSTRAPPPPPPAARSVDEEEDDDETTPALTPAPTVTQNPPGVPPPVPGGRPAPPPVPAESRPPPPPPPGNVSSPTDGSASDDELSGANRDKVPDSAASEHAQPPRLPPQPPMPMQPMSPTLPARSPPTSPRPEAVSPTSPTTTTSKRNSRPPPPIPGSAPAPPPASSRPPPPPPPGPGGLSRESTADMQAPSVSVPTRPPQAGEENETEATEYEGDYDTDIGSSVPHKDALKAHARDSSQEDNSFQSPSEAPPGVPPPIPTAAAPRAVPPPVPSQPPQPPPEPKRRSVDVPRGAPPPPPPSKDPVSPSPAQEEYDPYNYAVPTPYSHKTPRIEEEAYFPDQHYPQSPPERRAPPPAPSGRSARASLDVGRKSMSNRRSVDMQRPSIESGFIASDIDLAVQSGWWKQANQVPPVLQGRRDIYFECDESTTTNQGSKTVITREIFVLFQDYSQSIITVRYDPYNQSDVELEQRHEPPPRALRQDQMEDFYERFGRPIAEAAASKKDSVVGDGTPQSLVLELLKPFADALRPVGTRAYGALVYSNMANASTQQNDVIRPGDILSIRNAKFQGKHGPMHAKYSAEVGKPDHVGIVAEWDGTKKKVRAWEQGRESKKVKVESFKLDDLRSGEVKIWRVMPRNWVGWNSQA